MLAAVPVLADNCAAHHIDKTVTVTQVVDGDTVRLADRQLVRFIGINSPEIDHQHGQSEPFAEAARDQLKKIIGKDTTLLLQFGEEKTDRHGRWLAHIFTPDGTNVQQQLLQQGLAFQIVVPPNLFGLDCYRRAEQTAQAKKRGVWSHKQFLPRTAAELTDSEHGFRFVTGTIGHIGESRKSVWLNLVDADTGSGPGRHKSTKVALRISRAHLHYFRDMDVLKWQGRRVTARGWIYPHKGEQVMSVKHPAALQFHDQ